METLAIIGQVVFGLYFIYNGLNHFLKSQMMKEYAKSKNVPAPGFTVALSGLLILAGGLSVLLGLYLKIGLTLILVFLVGVSFWMHSFWADEDPNQKMNNMVNFMKNWALIAAVLFMYGAIDAWPWVANLS